MNIVINGKCSKNCAFCFQDKEFRSKKDMDIKTFKEIIDWLIGSHHNGSRIRIALLGGEPTIHPDFDEMLNYLIYKQLNKNKIIDVLLISNGDVLKKHISKINQIKNFTILLNVSSMSSDEEIIEKLTLLKENKIEVVPSLTVSTFSVLDKLKLMCSNFKNINTYRVSSSSDSSQIDFNYFEINKKYLMEAYSFLTIKNKDISTDCTKIPKCVFTKKEWEEYNSFNLLLGGNNSLGAACGANSGDILPDGTIIHCMPLYKLNEEKLKFSDFDSVFQAYDYSNLLIPYKIEEKMIKSQKCQNCIEYKTRRCFAGCLGMDITPGL